MPNILTNAKDVKVAQSALKPFMATLLPMRAFSSNFSPEPADKLDTIRVPIVGAPSPASDFGGSYTANADSSIDVAPVQLNHIHTALRQVPAANAKIIQD